MTKTLKIDFVSDVSCPWCAIGLAGLDQARERLAGEIDVALHFQPFELNPDMPAGGQDATEYLQRKYGASDQQLAATRETIRQRGEQAGFVFAQQIRSRIYNTFDAHRLLHWAGLEGRQPELKRALFRAYFTDGESPASHEVLVRLATQVGLDAGRAAQVLAGDEYADEVRAAEQRYQRAGIHSVPAIIINDRHLIQGGQSAEVFEQALRQIAGQS